jgi:hypothetical protein
MGIENGSGIPVFNGEALSRSFGLADKFKNTIIQSYIDKMQEQTNLPEE